MVEIKNYLDGIVLVKDVPVSNVILATIKDWPGAFKEMQRDLHLEVSVNGSNIKFARMIGNKITSKVIKRTIAKFESDVNTFMSSLINLSTNEEKEEQSEETQSRRIVAFAIIPIFEDELES